MGLVYKLDRLYRIGQESAALIYLNVFFDPAQSPKLRFNTNPFGVGLFHDSPGDRDIFFEWFVTRVDHYRTVKSGINTFVAGRFIPVVQMDRPYALINPGRLGDGLKESRIHSTRISVGRISHCHLATHSLEV